MAACEKCWGSGKQIDHRALGQVARDHRRSLRVSMADMARRLGFTESHLSYLENGKRGWKQADWNKVREMKR